MLDGIEDGLRAHDGRLASLFATFTRLTGQEQMPELERLKPTSRGAAVRPKWRTVRAGEQRTNRLGERTGGQGGPPQCVGAYACLALSGAGARLIACWMPGYRPRLAA